MYAIRSYYVVFHGAVDQGEPHPGTGAGARLLGGEKRLEDPLPGLRGHPDSRVLHREPHDLPRPGPSYNFV